MSDAACYEMVPLFLIRLAGTPFDALEALASPQTVRTAVELLALRREARAIGEAGIQSLKAEGMGGSALGRVARKVAALRPVKLAAESQSSESLRLYEQALEKVQRCEQALEEVFAREKTLARRSLRAAAAAHLPGFSVFTSASAINDLFQPRRLSDEAPPLNAEERLRERHYLLYLQRVAAKNDTISAWGPTAWGRLKDDARGWSLNPVPGVAGRDVYAEKWVTLAFIDAINRDPEVAAELVPRLDEAGFVDDDGFLRTDTGEVIPLTAEERECLQRVDGRPAYLIGAPERLASLVERGVLKWQLTRVTLQPHSLQHLRADVQAWRSGPARERWAAELDKLLLLLDKFKLETAPHERSTHLLAAQAQAEAIGGESRSGRRTLYRGANALTEDCVRDSGMVLGPDVVAPLLTDAAPWLDLWRDAYCYLAHRVAAGLRELLASAPRVRGKVYLPGFLRHCREQGLDLPTSGLLTLARPAVEDVRQALLDATGDRPDAEEWVLTPKDCQCVRNRFAFPKFRAFTDPSVDFLVAGVTPDGVGHGDPAIVIGELHAPVVMLQHGQAWACPEPDILRSAAAEAVSPLGVVHYGNVRVNATGHTTVDFARWLPGRFHLAAPERGLPEWPQLPPARVEVAVEAETGDVVLKSPDGRTVGSFARDWVVWIAFHPFVFPRRPHSPRLRLGRVVVQRQMWTVEAAELATDGAHTEAQAAAALLELCARRGIPRRVYIRPAEGTFDSTKMGDKEKDRKAIMTDLGSILGIELFVHWLHKHGRLDVVEMLPAPERLLWQEADGRYCFEIRALVRAIQQAG